MIIKDVHWLRAQHKMAGRFAPSPSGDLHLGNLRTALLAWLFAKKTGRDFLLRFENLDRGRDAGVAKEQRADLEKIGITFDGEVTQSERTEIYAVFLNRLVDAGAVYECYCSRREILEAPRAPHEPPGSYPGNCRNLSDLERIAKRLEISPRQPALRIKTPRQKNLAFKDLVFGEQCGSIDDFVLQRGDGVYAYNFAVVVDDHLTGVDQVVRGRDLLSSTARQIFLQKSLEFETPEYAHVPLLLGASGERLAKRDGAITLAQLRELGIEAPRVFFYLTKTLGLTKERENISTVELLERFNPELLPKEDHVFEIKDLMI